MKLFLSTIAKFFFLLCIVGIDAGFLPALGGNWNIINIALVFAIFFMFIFRNSIAYPFYFASILLLSFTAGNLFLLPLLSGFIALFLINILLERFFTNRSYYVLIALGLIAWFTYYSIYGILLALYRYWFPEKLLVMITKEWILSVVAYAPFVLLFLSIGYVAITFMSKRFKSYFIISDY